MGVRETGIDYIPDYGVNGKIGVVSLFT